MIEFALTAPMLIVLLLGLVEMGHAFNSYMTIVAAARDSARLGAQISSYPPDTTDENSMMNLVLAETSRLENAPIPTGCNGGNAGICFTSGTKSGPTEDKWVEVKVCYNHTMILGVPGVGNGPINMCSSTRIRLANF
jgi:Flp pilus assembly protein TadG